VLCHDLHRKHGRATYVQSDTADASHVMSTSTCDVVEVGGYLIANVYKPPSVSWEQQILPILKHPAVYTGDFNSHHTDWDYEHIDEDGERLSEWASNNDLVLINDPKQRRTFHSARWNRDYSPDLCWVSSLAGHPQPATVTVLEDFPHSQHRPMITYLGLRLPTIHSVHKPRWSFRKAEFLNRYTRT
jgi:hypothetical protein